MDATDECPNDVGLIGAAMPPRRDASALITAVCVQYAAGARYQGVALADLCTVAGVSERRVRHAFYDCYGMSPTAYMRTAALYEVRRALLEREPVRDAVTRAASDFGFWHLSRFAAQYRAVFGERPSATVARRAQPYDVAYPRSRRSASDDATSRA